MVRSTALSADVVRELEAERPGPCVSLFLTLGPPERGREVDRLRFRDLLRRAESELGRMGVLADGLGQILGPVRAAIVEQASDTHPAATIACFAAPGYFRLVRGGAAGMDEVVVGHRFALRPLRAQLAGEAAREPAGPPLVATAR